MIPIVKLFEFMIIAYVTITLHSKGICSGQQLINIFANHSFIECRQCFIKIGFISQMIITCYFSVYLLRTKLFRNLIFLPLCPEKFDLFEQSMIIFDLFNSCIPRPALENLSNCLMIVASWISIKFEYYVLLAIAINWQGLLTYGTVTLLVVC